MSENFLLRHALRYRGPLLAVSALTLASSLFVLAVPWLAGQFLGGILGSTPSTNLPVLTILILVVIIVTVLTIATSVVSAKVSERILADMRLDAFTHVQALPLRFHDSHRQGDMLNLLTFEVANLSAFLSSTLARTPSMMVTALGAIILLFILDYRVGLVLPVLMPAIYILLRLVGRRLRDLGARVRQAESQLLSEAETTLETLAAIKTFVAEDRRREAYAGHVENVRKHNLRNQIIISYLSPLIASMCGLTAIAILLLVSEPAPGAEPITGPDLFSILLYAALLTRPVGALAGLYGQFQWAMGILSRMEAVMAIEPEVRAAGEVFPGSAKGRIVFNEVDFSYPGRAPILQSATLTIEPGERVALTGPNGAGKSTLIKLALRLYQLDAGQIYLDDTDISRLSLEYLRSQFGYVPQRPALFDGSVRENIRFGRTQVSDADMQKAIRLAQAEAFIARLPEGLDTRIGDRGVRLSGGQCQRIALTRALLADPPILIFDEATSMFDVEAEAAFVKSCLESLEARTVILVTHRPASLALADRVLAVEDGSCRELSQEQISAFYGAPL
ncbi:MAG: ABC transporter ATP-binding protein [Alteraurantiacibacter sp.]